MTDETAKKCETALRQVQWWSRIKVDPGEWGEGCLLCSRQVNSGGHRQDCPIGIALAALRDETAEPRQPDTPELKASNLLCHVNLCDVGECKPNELANLIASHERLLEAVINALPTAGERWLEYYAKDALDKAWKPHDA